MKSKHPKEEAERIITLFTLKGNYLQSLSDRKDQALLCIDEKINLINAINNDGADDYYDELLEVKEHINKM